MSKIKVVLALIGFLLLFTGLMWFFMFNGIAMQSVGAPMLEGVRRDTFEETKSYNQGMVQELQNMQFEYIKATPEQQAMLRVIILHRAADYPNEKLPTDLQKFIQELKQ